MKLRILTLLLISFLFTNTYGQNKKCSCTDDLIFLDEKIRKTPAYKANKDQYKETYSNTLEKVDDINTIFDCHVLLNTLLLSINDNHSRIYGLDTGASSEIKNDPDQLTEFKSSKLYNAYPRLKLDLDSLETILASKNKKDKEGVYQIKDYLRIGVFKTKTENTYKGIVINSVTEIWAKGEIIYSFVPYGNDYFLGIGGSLSSKRLIAYTERIENGFFHFMGFQKDEEQTNYSIETLSGDTYYREEISEDITYLKIGSFNSWYPTLSDAEKFYASLDGNLSKPNLIIDLRNNGGGGERNSDILYDIIEDYAKQNNVYVLINHRTVSNAEQFALRLKGLENSKLFGMRTNGTLAYEIKGESHNLPCSNFVAVLSSKKHKEYLTYESQGVEPTIKLNTDSDWIEQMKIYIENN